MPPVIRPAEKPTLKWGTQGMFSTVICISSDSADEVETHLFGQGDGLKTTRILLKQGGATGITQFRMIARFLPPRPRLVTTYYRHRHPLGSGSSTCLHLQGEGVDNNYRGARRQGRSARKM